MSDDAMTSISQVKYVLNTDNICIPSALSRIVNIRLPVWKSGCGVATNNFYKKFLKIIINYNLPQS